MMDDVSYNNIDRNDVYTWLSRLTTKKPLPDYWLSEGDGNHVIELYKQTGQKNGPDLWVWVVATVSMAMICMCIVILIGLGKCCKWEASHGKNYDLWKLSKSGARVLCKKIKRKTTTKNRQEYTDPYEMPVSMEMDEIVVYKEGRRRTLDADEKIQLLTEAYLHSTESTPNSTRSNSLPPISSNKKKNSFGNVNHSPRTKSANQSFSPRTKSKKFSLKPSYLAKILFANQDDDKSSVEDFQTRPLPPLPTSPDFVMQGESPFVKHNILNKSIDDRLRRSTGGSSKAKLNYEQFERMLKKNSSEELYRVNVTATRKNTLSEFRKHKSTYNKNREKEITEFEILRDRSNSIDERLSECSLKRQRRLIRRSRSMDDLENVTINQLYVDIKTTYEEVPDYIKQLTKQPYESKRTTPPAHMTSPRDGGITTSTDNVYNPNENEYAKILDMFVDSDKTNIQKRPMPPVPTLLDLCFMNQNPASQRHIVPLQTKDGRHLSSQFPSFRSSVSGSSGAYAKIPDIIDFFK